MNASLFTLLVIPMLGWACSRGADSGGDQDLDGPRSSDTAGPSPEPSTATSSSDSETNSSDGPASVSGGDSSSGSGGSGSTGGNDTGSGGAGNESGSVLGGDSTMSGGETTDAGTASASNGGVGGTLGSSTSGGEENTEPAPEYPSWADNVLPVFGRSCGDTNTACHSEAAYVGWPDSDCRGWLSLVNAPLGSTFLGEYRYGETNGCPDIPLPERLLMQPWQCESGQYVVPGDAEASYLYRKIAGGPYCELEDGPSEPMPNVGTMSDRDIDIIRNWIDSGAPFDN